MGIKTWLKNHFSPKARLSEYIQQRLLEIYGGGSTSSGVSVNSDTAMRLSTVQSCVRVRTATVGQIPCHVMERAGRMRNKAEDFYLYELLHDQPNSWMTSTEFWAMVEAFICMRGNFIAFKSGLPGRPIRELIPINWDRVAKCEQHPDYSLTYDIRMANGEIRTYTQDQIMHIRGLLTLDGFTGLNPIEYDRETIGNGIAQVKHLGHFFGKGMRPGAVVEHPLTLNAKAHAGLRDNLKEKMSGLGTHWDLVLIDEGMKIQFPEIKLVDQQYLELMKMNEAQICGLFRVPQMLIASGDKAPTYASSEQFWINYLAVGVTPDTVNYEKAIRRDLLTPEEKKRYYVKFETRALLRSAFKEQMEGFQIAVNTEIYSPNEVREFMDMNPYEGGDEYRTRTSTVKDSKGDKGNEPKVQK